MYYVIRIDQNGRKKLLDVPFDRLVEAESYAEDSLQEDYESALECEEAPPSYRYRVVFIDD